MTKPYLITKLTQPQNLKDVRDALNELSDEVLIEHKVFHFKWGNRAGTCEWKLKATPKQYWKSLEKDEVINEP